MKNHRPTIFSYAPPAAAAILLLAGAGCSHSAQTAGASAPTAPAAVANTAAPGGGNEGAAIEANPNLSPQQKQAAFTALYRRQSQQQGGAGR